MDNLLNRIDKYNKENIEDITKFLSSTKKDIKNFSKYILFNPHIGPNFLPKIWRQSFFTSSDLLSLLREIENSIYQTKNICFPIVDGEPHIVFKNKNDFDFNNDLLMDCEILKSNEDPHSIYFLKDMNDFIEHHSCWFTNKIKEHFFHHIEMYGEESAVEHFSSQKEFEKNWIQEYNSNNIN